MLKEIIRHTIPGEALSLLRSAKLYYATRSYKPRVVRHSYGDNSFLVHIKDANAQLWYDGDWNNRVEIAFLEQFRLKPGTTVFNLGAHQGIVALILAAIVGETGQVIALEAGPYNAGVAELNRSANNANNLRVLNAAIAAECGTLRFAESLCGHVDDGCGGIEVPALTIDKLAHEHGHPAVVYMDIEGFECEALRGATKTLSIGSDWFIEVHSGVGLEKYGGSIAKLLSFFPSDKYELFYSGGNGLDFSPLGDREQIVEPLVGKRWFLVAACKDQVTP